MLECKICGQRMEVTEIDRSEGIAWICCPSYMAGDDEHDSYPIELTDEIEGIFIKQG